MIIKVELANLTALTLGKKIQQKEISVKEVVEEYLERINQLDSEINSFITVTPELALKRADEVQKAILKKELTNVLAGVPMAIKDNICSEGILTTCGSKMLSNYKPIFDAEVVCRLNQLGAIMIGKTNMDEFAMGSTSRTSYFGAVSNPNNHNYSAGGSSSGSAAAVAAGLTPYSLGTDTGGSVRQPAAFCGITGIKPTYGAVSRYGLIAYASSLDQIGVLSKSVSDSAAVLEVISGYDSKDATSSKEKLLNLTEACDGQIEGMKIGIINNYVDSVEFHICKAVEQAISELKNMGAIVNEINIETLDYAVPTYYVIATAEASSNLSRYDGVKFGYKSPEAKDIESIYQFSRSEGFGSEVKRRCMVGTFVLSAGHYEDYYQKAIAIQNKIKEDFEIAFKTYDLLISPTTLTTAYPLDEDNKKLVDLYQSDKCTVAINLAGLPAISVPCGVDKNGLPIGLQFIGKAFSEKKLIKAAYAYESIAKKYQGTVKVVSEV